ncbi:MAG: glycosyl transferase family 1 [Deltaproteobacteria bacterium GWA2_42_85]|nr:MAG: glycosyl transferase family 1 [Deltaproteobacteria bacterium GWA2_42_85]
MLDRYESIVGKGVIDELRLLSDRLRNRSVQHINSTAVGGGVAEILNRMVPLLKELGVNTRWDVIKGGEQFFEVTKKIHNALHGMREAITPEMWDIFWKTGEDNAREIECSADIMFIHDPQPIALINQKAARQNRWIWRCHIDISNAQTRVLDALRSCIIRYDAAIFSAPSFAKEFPIRQFLISPSIDPLSDKNRELPQEVIDETLLHYDIKNDKPMITQISRFDYLKDPIGVIEVYRKVKRYVDCQLALAGGVAADDPESAEVLQTVKRSAEGDQDIHILLMPHNDIHVNALQRASTVIIQKSVREGFGLTVSEALWKGKPVVASAVGGIPLQIRHKYHGLLCHSIDGAALAVKQLLQNPEYAKRLGANGREHVRQNFLLTRHLREYLLLFLSLYNMEDIIYL